MFCDGSLFLKQRFLPVVLGIMDRECTIFVHNHKQIDFYFQVLLKDEMFKNNTLNTFTVVENMCERIRPVTLNGTLFLQCSNGAFTSLSTSSTDPVIYELKSCLRSRILTAVGSETFANSSASSSSFSQLCPQRISLAPPL